MPLWGQPWHRCSRCANTFRTDGGRAVKELCRGAKANGRPEYRKVTGVGKRASAFTSSVLGRPTPVMVLYTLRKDSKETGRTIELRIIGSDEALAAVAPQLDRGIRDARQEGRRVRQGRSDGLSQGFAEETPTAYCAGSADRRVCPRERERQEVECAATAAPYPTTLCQAWKAKLHDPSGSWKGVWPPGPCMPLREESTGVE